jgi:sulfide:quinone oxidoreductase
MNGQAAPANGAQSFDIVIVGGGAAGIGAASSILRRRADYSIAIVEPKETHSYQPGWTMVGAGVFDFPFTQRPMAKVMPRAATWFKAAVSAFAPDTNEVLLDDGRRLSYSALIAAPGLKLDWDKVAGLKDALGKNGVTSNYKEGMSVYTWDLVQKVSKGSAIFTMSPMPIKCAGAPQKAMYLSCDYWRRAGKLNEIEVRFCNANAVLFGVADYVPALTDYVKRYGIRLELGENLVAVDGRLKTATFERKAADGSVQRIERKYDFLHVCPPQAPPDFVKASPLANAAGWIDVDQETLQHAKYKNVFSLGDACSAPNAKTAAAVRKQAPVVAENLIALLDKQSLPAIYKGYGSCPLTVERGKAVLAEFGYGGKLQPSFPRWMINGVRPTWQAWFLKVRVLPFVYWRMLLRGRELLAKPKRPPTRA